MAGHAQWRTSLQRQGHLSVTESVWLMQSIAAQFHMDLSSYGVQ